MNENKLNIKYQYRSVSGNNLLCDDDHLNEDAVSVGRACAIVVDGATPLFIDNDTLGLVAKFSSRLASDLNNNFLQDQALARCVFDTRDAMANDFISPNQVDPPSASLAAAVIGEEKINYIVIGDCKFVRIPASGGESIVFDERLPDLNRKSTLELKKLQDSGVSHKDAVSQCMGLQKLHRINETTRGGGMSLSATVNQIPVFLEGEFFTHSGDRILLCSDGFSRLVDTYKTFLTYRDLADNISQFGIDSIIKKLREIEDNDSECRVYPRMKKSDDASCVLIEIK